MRMPSNVGGIDRFLRAGFGITAIYLAFFDNSILDDPLAKWGLGVPGIIFLATSLIRFCPLYGLIGFNSFRSSRKSTDQ